jgi:hypothetical protein
MNLKMESNGFNRLYGEALARIHMTSYFGHSVGLSCRV